MKIQTKAFILAFPLVWPRWRNGTAFLQRHPWAILENSGMSGAESLRSFGINSHQAYVSRDSSKHLSQLGEVLARGRVSRKSQQAFRLESLSVFVCDFFVCNTDDK